MVETVLHDDRGVDGVRPAVLIITTLGAVDDHPDENAEFA
jgi:hypothetical protein